MYVRSINSFEQRLWLDWCFDRRAVGFVFSEFEKQSRCFANDLFKCITNKLKVVK